MKKGFQSLAKRSNAFCKKHQNLVVAGIIFLFVLASYGRTLLMYWWVDDWGLLFKMIHPEAAPGNLGTGVFGAGPYRYLATPFILLYPVLGKWAFSYFGIGLILYFLAALSLYALGKKLTSNKFIPLASALIFASGYIGSYALYRLSNSYQLTMTAALFCITVNYLASFYDSEKWKYYFLSIVFFIITLEFFFLRANGILFILLGLGIFYFKFKRKISSLLKFVVLQIPFTFIYYFFYFIDNRVSGSASSVIISGIIKNIVIEGNYDLLGNLVITITRGLVPDPIIVLFHGVAGKVGTPDNFALEFGIAFLLIIFLVFLVQLFKRNDNARIIPLGIIWIIGVVFSYFVYSPANNLDSTSRYIIPALTGTALVYSTLISFIKYRKLRITFLLAICSALIYLTNKEEARIVKYISTPDRQGYKMIQREVPSVDQSTFFYIGAEDDPVYKNNILGGMPQLGISIFKNYHDTTNVIDFYDNFMNLIVSSKAKISNVYTFFYSRTGYKNTTNLFRALLERKSDPTPIVSWVVDDSESLTTPIKTKTIVSKRIADSVGINPIFETEVSYNSLVPTELKISMAINPLTSNNFVFPYFDVSGTVPSGANLLALDNMVPGLKKYDEALIIPSLLIENEKAGQLNSGKASAISSWPTTPPENLIDGREDTNWGSNNVPWNYREFPQGFTLDLGKVSAFHKFYWVNHYRLSTPTTYSIYYSVDGINWKLIKKVEKGAVREGGEIVVEEFSEISARFLRFDVFETFGDSPPSVREIWVSNIKVNVDPLTQKMVEGCPFCFVPSIYYYNQIMSIENNISVAQISWITDRADIYSPFYSKEFRIYLDGKVHNYTIYLPAQGTLYKKLKLSNFPVPAEITLSQSTIRSLSLEEIRQLGLFK